MYTRRFDDHRPPPDGYSGTFIKNERSFPEQKPTEAPCSEAPPCEPEAPSTASPPVCDRESTPCRIAEPLCTPVNAPDREPPHEKRGGFLSGLFSRFSRGFELDDLLLLGLLLLLLGERDEQGSNGDELLLVLGLLFFMGF